MAVLLLPFNPQVQVNRLDKAIKSAAEQKEQLEHESLKINRDIADMVCD